MRKRFYWSLSLIQSQLHIKKSFMKLLLVIYELKRVLYIKRNMKTPCHSSYKNTVSNLFSVYSDMSFQDGSSNIIAMHLNMLPFGVGSMYPTNSSSIDLYNTPRQVSFWHFFYEINI